MAPPRIYCCTNGCLNSSIKRPELSFFKLPREEERRNEWLRLISREDLRQRKAKSYVVCEEHFRAHEILRAAARKTLKKTALPSLRLPGMSARQVVAFPVLSRADAATQTSAGNASHSSDNAKTRQLKLRRMRLADTVKLDEIDEKSEKLQKATLHKLCDKFLTDELSHLVKSQMDKKIKKRHLPVTTEVNEKIMSILQIKIDNMTERERNCVVIVDTMDLKANLVYNKKEDRIIGFHEVDGAQTPEPATAALVLVLRGIVRDWRQPAGFALLSEYVNYDEITKWVDKLVGRLLDMGLTVRALVSDMEMDMYNLAKERPISPEKPFFFMRRKKLFHVFDAPHLVKMFRDSLLVHDFNFQGCVANFEPILQFYNQNKEKSCRLAPKLTASHIEPNNIEKQELRLAVQLLSDSVAAAILTYIDFYVIDESGRDTVRVIKLMNDLFDLLNSASLWHDNVFKRAFSGDPAQLHLFNEAINFFGTLKLLDPRNGGNVTSSSKFIEGFQVTIASILLLLEDLRKKGIKAIKTRRLTKEATERMFSEIRSLSGRTGDLTSRQFIASFRELFIRDLMRPTAGKDCSIELAKMLVEEDDPDDLDDEGEEPNEPSAFAIDDSENKVEVKSSEYNRMEIPDKNTVVYLSSYLLKKCSEKHKDCQILKSYIAPAPEQRTRNFSADVRYQRYREYSEETSSSLLVVPYDDFIRYVETMEEEFRGCFKRRHLERRFATAALREISQLSFAPPCPCFPIEYLKKLFIRMRIFHTIQFNNKKMRASFSKRKYFTIPHL